MPTLILFGEEIFDSVSEAFQQEVCYVFRDLDMGYQCVEDMECAGQTRNFVSTPAAARRYI